MNGHSDAVDQQNAEYAKRQEQADMDLQEFYGCVKRLEVKRYFSDDVEEKYEAEVVTAIK